MDPTKQTKVYFKLLTKGQRKNKPGVGLFLFFLHLFVGFVMSFDSRLVVYEICIDCAPKQREREDSVALS